MMKVIAAKRGEEYMRWQVNAAQKIKEEAKRRKAILQEHEEARLRMETEEEVGQEAGMNTVGYFLQDPF